MTLQDILTPDCTLCAVSGSSKKRILDKICAIAATKIADHSPFELLESLTAREKMGSTGIGNGIAIPHGRLNGTQQVITIVMTTEQTIAFDAIDNRPVDIFIALFVPEDCCQDHLTTLQSIAKLFSDKHFAKNVRKCRSNNELFQIIQQATNSN
jgi:PTS system nitrogen regulatory IIA component